MRETEFSHSLSQVSAGECMSESMRENEAKSKSNKKSGVLFFRSCRAVSC
jgi:hypothetical protein